MTDRWADAYGATLIDPPWAEHGGTPRAASWGGGRRGADKHYATLPTKEIPGVVQGSPAFRPAADSHLYLWATCTFLPDALWTMEQLGFRYVTTIAWVKTGGRFGLGRYFRGRVELLLFGVRGKGLAACTGARNLSNLIAADPAAHSRKPAESLLLVEARSRGPWMEMFGRGSLGRPGWSSWGWEAT